MSDYNTHMPAQHFIANSGPLSYSPPMQPVVGTKFVVTGCHQWNSQLVQTFHTFEQAQMPNLLNFYPPTGSYISNYTSYPPLNQQILLPQQTQVINAAMMANPALLLQQQQAAAQHAALLQHQARAQAHAQQQQQRVNPAAASMHQQQGKEDSEYLEFPGVIVAAVPPPQDSNVSLQSTIDLQLAFSSRKGRASAAQAAKRAEKKGGTSGIRLVEASVHTNEEGRPNLADVRSRFVKILKDRSVKLANIIMWMELLEEVGQLKDSAADFLCIVIQKMTALAKHPRSIDKFLTDMRLQVVPFLLNIRNCRAYLILINIFTMTYCFENILLSNPDERPNTLRGPTVIRFRLKILACLGATFYKFLAMLYSLGHELQFSMHTCVDHKRRSSENKAAFNLDLSSLAVGDSVLFIPGSGQPKKGTVKKIYLDHGIYEVAYQEPLKPLNPSGILLYLECNSTADTQRLCVEIINFSSGLSKKERLMFEKESAREKENFQVKREKLCAKKKWNQTDFDEVKGMFRFERAMKSEQKNCLYGYEKVPGTSRWRCTLVDKQAGCNLSSRWSGGSGA